MEKRINKSATNNTVEESFSERHAAAIQAITTKYSRYWELNDKAHRFDHFFDVYKTALEILKRVKNTPDYGNFALLINPDHVLIAAFFHDLFTWERSNHHLMAASFIMTTNDDVISELLPDHSDRLIVAAACREHRASYNGDFSSTLSELISSADRGMPLNLETHLQRARDFREGAFISQEELEASAVRHIKEKFGRGGYARYPNLYRQVFADEIETMLVCIDML